MKNPISSLTYKVKKLIPSHIWSYIILFLCSMYSVIVVFKYFNFQTYSVFSTLAIILLTWLSYKVWLIRDKMIVLSAAIYSFLFSVATSIGFLVVNNSSIHNPGWHDFLAFPGFLFFFYVIFCLLVQTIQKKPLLYTSQPASLKFWIICFIIITVCWMPYFLTYYPGIATIDSIESMRQGLRMQEVTNHHPLMFTIYVGICMRIGRLLGNLNLGIAIFSMSQMLLMSLALSYSVYWIRKKGAPFFAVLFTLLFYALNPVIAVYSITMWKDILFSGGILLLILFIYDIVESRGALFSRKSQLLYLAILLFFIAFTRNNGIFVVIATLIALVIYCKSIRKRLLATGMTVIIVTTLIQGPAYNALGIPSSSFTEKIGIPMQQIAYTVKNDGNITEEQKEFLSQIIPLDKMKEQYNPTSFDTIKFGRIYKTDFVEKHKAEVLKVWAQMLPSNFGSYVKAYFLQTLGYWRIGTYNWMVCDCIDHPLVPGDTSLYNTDIIKKVTGHSLKNSIHNFMSNVSTIPIASDIFCLASLAWFMMLFITVMISQKRPRHILLVLPLLSIWGVMMIAAPVACEFRYMYSFVLSIPILLLLMFPIKSQKEDSATTTIND